jgi:hypothetical protein
VSCVLQSDAWMHIVAKARGQRLALNEAVQVQRCKHGAALAVTVAGAGPAGQQHVRGGLETKPTCVVDCHGLCCSPH